MNMLTTKLNRLANETSPYLLQHRANPVDWYPWGEEAIAKARAENKPIFLSVGYSTCYWCHVMERQCFENQAIADEMNKRFICIKVDREERPDIDQLYMTAVQLLTRHGGWPMSVFLLPDLRPYYGGTYFPPGDSPGRPGFPTLLRVLDDATRTRASEVNNSAGQITAALAELGRPQPPPRATLVDDALLNRLIERSTADFDARHGGFGSAPKFPRETLLELLLIRQRMRPDPQQLSQITQSLDAMAHGGIRDHLGGGFHRYSTDGEWLIPHFEIMLYDNAMLGWCYAEAYSQTHDVRYASIARGIFDFVMRDMTAPTGAFYTAFDAEVDAREGMPYLWTRIEVEQTLAELLGDAPDAESRIARFCEIYGLDTGPNFADPHHGNGIPDSNVLYIVEPDGSPSPLLDESLMPLREALLNRRRQRKQPLLDTKIITAWNALMIRALAHGGKVLDESRYTSAAIAAATFLLEHHRTEDGSLRRTSRDGVAKHSAFLDDYAFFAQALLELGSTTGDIRWTNEARGLYSTMTARFADPAGGFFFTEAGATDLLVRQKVSGDSPLPSGNAVAAMVALSLGDAESCRTTVDIFTGQLLTNAESMSALLQAASDYLKDHEPFVVTAAGISKAPELPPVALSASWINATQLRVRIDIAPGFHINGHTPATGLMATQLSVTGPDAVALREINFPPTEPLTLRFADQPLQGYTGSVIAELNFDPPPKSKQTIGISLRFQACTEDACLPPMSQSINL